MTTRAGYCTPLLHVADVTRSLRFYAHLGFEVSDVEGDPACPAWARMHCEGGALMFLATDEDEPLDPRAQTILLALYTEDLEQLRRQLRDAGLDPAPIGYPPYMPSGEMRVDDPDGYVILVNQWGTREHEAWEAGRGERVRAWSRG